MVEMFRIQWQNQCQLLGELDDVKSRLRRLEKATTTTKTIAEKLDVNIESMKDLNIPFATKEDFDSFDLQLSVNDKLFARVVRISFQI